MEKEFVPYEIALALKELGFDEKCISVYLTSIKRPYPMYRPYTINEQTDELLRPLYQQAFRWFREKHNLYPLSVNTEYHSSFSLDMKFLSFIRADKSKDHYAEAELECLKKLIEIVKNK